MLALVAGLGSTLPAAAQTHVENIATLTYRAGDGERVVRSNAVGLDVTRTKRPTSFTFRLLPNGYVPTGATCEGTPPRFTPAPIDAATLAVSPPLAAVDITSPLIMVIEAEGANRDSQVRETVTIDFDTGKIAGKLPLLETGANTGVFAGAVPAANDNSDPKLSACMLNLKRGDHLRLSFTEDQYSYGSSIDLLIDPAGYVFDSRTGAVIDGAEVTLLDEAGQPATVFGDDGISRYPATVVSGAAVTDASGRRYAPLAGRFRFPFARPGRYSLKITPPGEYIAPSVVDRATLLALKDPLGDRFIIADASYGGFLTLANQDPVYVDVPLDRPGNGTLLLTKTASVRDASPGDFIQYRLQVQNRDAVPASGLVLSDYLPQGLRYERGSTRGGAEPTVSPDGRNLTFAIPAIAPSGSADIRYVVTVAPGAPSGEALNRAQIVGDGRVTSNQAAASVRLRPLLFTDAMTVIGRVTEGNCGDPVDRRKGIAGIRLLLEDGTFVVTDRDGLYHFEGVRAGRHVVQLDTASIPASYAPVACDVDTRQAKSAISRFVEAEGGVMKRVDFQLRPTGKAAAAIDALPIAVADDAAAAGNREWLGGQAAGIDWLFPQVDHNPRAPVLRVAIKHAPDQRVALTVNGRGTDPLAFDGADTAGAVAVSKWNGLPLQPGDNRLVARILAGDGHVVQTLERVVHYSGVGVRAIVDPGKSRLKADGLNRPLIAVRVTDKDGRPVRAGTLVPFRIDQPYQAAIEADLQQGRQLAGRERAATTARVVGDDGYAFIALQPTTQAGAVHAVVSLTDDKQVRTSEIRAWLDAAQQDWMVVGFGAGSIGYDMLSKHGRSLPRAERNAVVTDGQLAFYAKGRIKGSWLMTIAYDSDRAYDPTRGLLGTIDPDRYYTVYGDGSMQGYDAATRRKLYLRLERREFYALFGDFETGFTDTQLTRYSRTLNGVKAAYEGRRLSVQGFAAKTDTLYSRDEIQGNGLSGPYRLRARGIVPNSDKLRIEVRDRFRSEVIVSTTQLTRHIDYDIDIGLGTVRFRNPVLSRDASLNPIFIVADYEVEGGKTEQLAAAARVAAKLGRVTVGASVIRDETAGNATVAGADVKARFGTATEVRGEFATGGKRGLGRDIAFLAEAEHHGGGLDLLGYVRQQDGGFGVGQQNLVEAATRKIGIDGRVALTDRLSVTSTVWHQDMLASPATRTAGEARLEYRRAAGTVFVGGQFASDRGLDGGARDSRLLTLGGTQSLFAGKLTLAAQTQFAPGGDKASVDFPARHQLTAAWRIKPGLRLLTGYEIANGKDYTAHTAQVGFDVAPWTGAKLMSTLNQQAIGENGGRTYAQYGLSQSLPLGKRWSVDATLDATSTVRGRVPAGAVINAFQPVASGGVIDGNGGVGDRDFTAATLGATYRAQRWSWTGRLEYRDGENEDRFGIVTSLLRTLGEGRTIASNLRAFRVRNASGAVATQASADLALAWRPLDSRWSLLERLEFRHDSADGSFDDGNVLGVPAYGGGDQVTSRVVNNLAINYRSGPEGLGHGFEATLYYGAKYVAGRYADDVYDGFIDVVGFDLRQDLGTRFDIGVAGSVQHAWDRGVWSWSGGPSAGVSPAPNLWISAGYNIAGYRDRDFEADRYTRQGPYVTMRLKFDQLSLGGATRALFGR
ncbi:putative repeat protein (TIGR01451 family) [Sphingomonas insulae]|uniref:DUF11 domain-containing protein n=1 Tax=Sphingomonas insulae TaxID=424800 RepID=A0ABN1HLY4_9SPHN|nr:DUF11 domain-containing protein [Sphingomonas insulae]NIJ30144.1 putative repeat protein (TIGR01451 family) [Sphingomonas insulae]